LNISNAGFGALQSSLSVLVTITAILGGVIVDRAGCDKAALISTTIVFIGLFIMIIGVSLNIFYGCLLGLAMIGVGGNWVSTAQEASMIRVYPEARGQHKKHPHQSNEVSLAFGSLFSIGKIVSMHD
jgi:MFS family permease